MPDVKVAVSPLDRVTTGVPGLDALLHGGLLKSGVYLFLGEPGAGKTVLSNQVCFHHAGEGGRVVYLTLLAESHARMLGHLQAFDFFDGECVGRSITYLSGFQALEQDRLDGLLDLLRRTIQQEKATFLVVDGLITLGAASENEIFFKKFIHQLKAFVEIMQCTALLLTSVPSAGVQYPAQTMVDGIVSLRQERVGLRTVRSIEVVKFRGSPIVDGSHVFEIDSSGVTIHPRFEARLAGAQPRKPNQELIPVGISGLDTMLEGGVPSASSTLLAGSPGSGKTMFGLHFLAEGAGRGERGLYLGFYESPEQLVEKAAGVGLELAPFVAEGVLQLRWTMPFEVTGDRLLDQILQSVEEHGAKRFVLDGAEAFIRSLAYPERGPDLLGALLYCLHERGVSAVITLAVSDRADHLLLLPDTELIRIADNIIGLRYVEQGGEMRRLLSVRKKRDGSADPSVREFVISDDGIDVTGVGASKRPKRKATPKKKAPSKRKAGSSPAKSAKRTRR